jgi:hypothetical protein
MTRLARNPSATQQANRGTAVHARWRVGARGMLALAIHDVENGTAEVTLTPDASARETLPGRLSTHGAVDARGDAPAGVCRLVFGVTQDRGDSSGESTPEQTGGSDSETRLEADLIPRLERRSDPRSPRASKRGDRAATVPEPGAERAFMLRSADGALSATVTLVTTPDGATLLLTDLPERLGLMGGTYALDLLQLDR